VGRVFVAGSIIMDVVATASRHPKVGETVLGQKMFFFPGGKGANQAVAAARLGADAALIGRIGRDDFGAQMRSFLNQQGVDLVGLRESENAVTGSALIGVAQKDNAIVVVPAANAELGVQDIESANVSRGDVLLSQLEIPLPTVAAFLARGRACGARTIFNPAPAIETDPSLFRLADLVILNETELAAFARRKVDAMAAEADIANAARALCSRTDQVVCVTLGGRGAIAVIGSEVLVVEGRQVEVADTTGAGDCFAGAVAAELARGANVVDALGFANVAASICVQRMGAGPSMPSLDEVRATISHPSAGSTTAPTTTTRHAH
jgi:ribokinase